MQGFIDCNTTPREDELQEQLDKLVVFVRQVAAIDHVEVAADGEASNTLARLVNAANKLLEV